MTFTKSAAKEITKIMIRDGLSPETHAVRMRRRSCSVLTYTLDFDDKQRKFDILYESNVIEYSCR